MTEAFRLGALVLVANLPDILWLVGLFLVAFGVGMVTVPAGVIAGGVGLCFVGYASAEPDGSGGVPE